MPTANRDDLTTEQRDRLTLLSTATELLDHHDPLLALRLAADELDSNELIANERFAHLALTLLNDLNALAALRPTCTHDRHRYDADLGPANIDPDDIIHDDNTQLDCCDDPFTLYDELICHTFESPMTFFDNRLTNDLLTVIR